MFPSITYLATYIPSSYNQTPSAMLRLLLWVTG